MLYHQIKSVVQNKLTKTILFAISSIFVLQLLFLALSFSKISRKNLANDELTKKASYSLLHILSTSTMSEKQLVDHIMMINDSNPVFASHQLHLLLESEPRYVTNALKFDPLVDFKNVFKDHHYGFCTSYPIKDQWLNFCASQEDTMPLIAYLLSFINIILGISVLIYIVFVTKVIFPIKKFQYYASLSGHNLHYNPLTTSSFNIINQTASALNFMQSRMLQALHDKTKILGFIAHDLRTPLTRITMRLELKKIHCPKTLSDLNEMESMISEILSYSIEDRLMKEAKINTDIIKLFKKVIAEYQEMNKSIHSTFSDKNIFLFIRPLNFKRAIVNILDNAFKYGTLICLTCHQNETHVIIQITDNGPGVKESNLKQLCQPFFQEDKMRLGVGLGLTISQEIIQDLHGSLSFYNQKQGGLCVYINIPKKQR